MSDSRLKIIRDNLRQRRTIHDFTDEMPPWKTVRAALDSARFAPNHYFTQPWHFYRVGPKTKQRIVEINSALVAEKKGPAAADAKRRRWQSVPGWLVVTCRKNDNPLTAKEDYAACSCAVQNIMLELWASGIGCKWTTGGVTRSPDFFAALQIDPSIEDVVALLWYGYPKATPKTQRVALATKLTQRP